MDSQEVSHQIISSHFIGPQVENLSYFRENLQIIFEELEKARKSYFPQDGRFISEEMQQTPAFLASMDRLKSTVRKASNILGKSSVPFWSPRYEGHMCPEASMASLLGYFMTMLYNQNNAAVETGPLTTMIEIEVGKQLCGLLGYNTDPDDTGEPTGWGHITCDGTVANLESMWVARNLKFYPLSLRQAMRQGEALDFLSDRLSVENCQGVRKPFIQLSTWELLNLRPSDILDLPERLLKEYGISAAFLSAALSKFIIQSTGKDILEREFKMKPAQYMMANTRHYSWSKGAAITGIGSDNIIGVPLDLGARMDLNELEKMLSKALENEQPIFAVVAILGSTEVGSVDPLSGILALRKQFQAKGLSFLVHVDAAWGGYFRSMLPKDYRPGDVIDLSIGTSNDSRVVPRAGMRAQTQEDLYALRYADSTTVDPHKSGYIPYPAGGLCYRDGRLRYLVAWAAPYIFRESAPSIGAFSLEGSKPGAAAMATWLSNKIIGLNQEGYGSLLGEVAWACTRFSAEWASLTDASSPFICVPFNMLPSELAPDPTEAKLEAEKKRIQLEIVHKTNEQIAKEDARRPGNAKAVRLIRDIGPDLNINAFALNFRHEDGRLNTDIEEANYLMHRVVEILSVNSPESDPTKIPLFFNSTEFSDKLYGKCKENFVRRLGLEQSHIDLCVLRNVVTSPFARSGNFTNQLAQTFYRVVDEETKVVRKRNALMPDVHSFLIQGEESLYLNYLPMFHIANRRQQVIVSVEFGGGSKKKYVDMKSTYPSEPIILVTQDKMMLEDITDSDMGGFKARIMTKESGVILWDVHVTIRDTVVARPLDSKYRLEDYPQAFMPFYLYGNENEANIDHVITRAPNTHLSAGRCKLEWYKPQDPRVWDKPLVLMLEDVREATMQPFPPNAEIGSKNGAIIAHDFPTPKAGRKSYHNGFTKNMQTESKLNGYGNGYHKNGDTGYQKNGDTGYQKNGDAGYHKNGDTGYYKNGDTGYYKNGDTGYHKNGDTGYHKNGDTEYHKNGDTGYPKNGDTGNHKNGDTGYAAEAHWEDESEDPHKFVKAVTSEARSGALKRSNFFFRPGAEFHVGVWEDGNRSNANAKWASHELGQFVGRGLLTLGESVYVDSEAINIDPFKRANKKVMLRESLFESLCEIE